MAPPPRGAGARPGQARHAAAAGGAGRAGAARIAAVDRDAGGRRRLRRRARLARSCSRRSAAATTAAGVWMVDDPDRSPRVAGDYLAAGAPVLVEERVAMRRELAALVARSPFGQGAAWPVVETVQRDGICVKVIAPAPGAARRSSARPASSWRCGWRPSWAWSACWPSSCSRPTDGAAAGQRAGDAAAQLRALDHRRRAHQPVRAAPAGGAGLPARRHRRRSRR